MWALRRASLSLRSRGFNAGSSCACFRLTPTTNGEDEGGIAESPQISFDRSLSLKPFYHPGDTFLNVMVQRRELSSQADTRTKREEDDMEYGISELETPVGENRNVELVSEQESSDDNENVQELDNEVALSDTEIDSNEKKSRKKRARTKLFNAIANNQAVSVNSILVKWAEQTKEVRSEISLTIANLCRVRMFEKALQVSEWVEANKLIDMTEEDYKRRLDLIAKVHGLHKAEKYIERIPEAFRGEIMYSTLLNNCVIERNVKVAEKVFNKMKDLGLPVTALTCDQFLILYKKTTKYKIGSFLSAMKKENVQPSLLTYKIMIDAWGFNNEIDKIEKLVEGMKAEGVEPSIPIKLSLARHYSPAGLKEKAEAVLKEIEGENLKENKWVYRSLLLIYANMGKAEEVERIWEVRKSDHPQIGECLIAIVAFGKLNKIEEAEAIFEMMLKKGNKLSSKQYTVMLRVYASQKMLTKGEDLVRRMINSGCGLCPFTLDAIVKLYVNSGEARKVESIMLKAIQKYRMKPMHRTCMVILDEYASRGDVHGAERVFFNMRPHGYTSRSNTFLALIQAYINAKRPAYGIRERIKSDNVITSRYFSNKMAQVDAFDTQSPVLDVIADL